MTFSTERPSGGATNNRHCSDCFGRVCNTNTVYPAMTIVRAGTLDDASGLEPFAHMWTSRKRGWIAIDPAVPTFDKSPDPAEFMRLAMARRAG